ncbi:MAG TPA: cytochrome c biogenesis protein CcdA [Polyangiaceae bacterium]|nr:cytochrome c biogenesis protein CcdA [Polyangiaceae bacterium]
MASALALWLAPNHALAVGPDFSAAVERGPLEAAVMAWLGGLLVSLTPCVYPMIAITVSVFGAKKAQSRWHGIALSSAFVLGIVCMFVPLGVVAGLTGGLFGSVLQNRWVLVALATLFLAMAASLFGAFEVALPAGLVNRLATWGGIGPRGAFGLGLACGLIAAPCTGPVLTGILTFIAQSQSAVQGGLAMAAFSLGLGLPFFLVGAFAVQLPKSGRWMVHVKSLLAIVLAVVALSYLHTAFPVLTGWIRPSPKLFTVAAVVVLAGLSAGALHRDFASPDWREKLLKAAGASSTTLALFVLVLALGTTEQTLTWSQTSFDSARTSALEQGRPLLVDFTASWCGACKELEKHTFSDQQVHQEAGRFVAVRVDATDDEDPGVRSLMTRLGVVGLPTVLLFDSSGREAARFNDFVAAEEFLAALHEVR